MTWVPLLSIFLSQGFFPCPSWAQKLWDRGSEGWRLRLEVDLTHIFLLRFLVSTLFFLSHQSIRDPTTGYWIMMTAGESRLSSWIIGGVDLKKKKWDSHQQWASHWVGKDHRGGDRRQEKKFPSQGSCVQPARESQELPVPINSNTCSSLVIFLPNIRPWVDRSLASIQNINIFVMTLLPAFYHFEHPFYNGLWPKPLSSY